MAFDFFTVPPVTFQMLYCFFVIEHGRRRILHFNVTRHPEFIHRFLLHVLPSGFVKIRHFGFLSNPQRREALGICRMLLTATESQQAQPEAQPKPERRCPCCGVGTLCLLGWIQPGEPLPALPPAATDTSWALNLPAESLCKPADFARWAPASARNRPDSNRNARSRKGGARQAHRGGVGDELLHLDRRWQGCCVPAVQCAVLGGRRRKRPGRLRAIRDRQRLSVICGTRCRFHSRRSYSAGNVRRRFSDVHQRQVPAQAAARDTGVRRRRATVARRTLDGLPVERVRPAGDLRSPVSRPGPRVADFGRRRRAAKVERHRPGDLLSCRPLHDDGHARCLGSRTDSRKTGAVVCRRIRLRAERFDRELRRDSRGAVHHAAPGHARRRFARGD